MIPFSEQFINKTFPQRLKFVLVLIFLSYLAIIVRAAYLDIYKYEELSNKAQQQYQHSVNIKLQRGTIYDTNGDILAVSIELDSVFAIPGEIVDAEKQSQILAPIFDISPAKLKTKLTEKSSFVWLKRHLHPVQSKKIKQLESPGIYTVKEYERIYPNQRQSAQLIGFTGIDSQGLEGIEYEYNRLLMGTSTGSDALSKSEERAVHQTGKGGALQLTIDDQLQYIAERELTKGVKGMNAIKGIAIVMDSQSGSILAMANYPGFNPNFFENFNRNRFLNRAVSDAYEPGSTFKIITIAIALENSIVEKESIFNCENGTYKIQDREIHDVVPHGLLSLGQVIQKSSNICSAKIGLRIPKKLFYETILKFGFGAKTDIGLPGEALGIVHPYQTWTDIDVATISFGHTISASAIQLITAINTIAMNGTLVKPTIIKRKWSPSGKEVPITKQKSVRILRKTTTDEMTRYMISVTQPGGTGLPAAIPGMNVAGKTGTARKFDWEKGEYSSENHVASFVGFFPAEKAQYTILVIIDEPKKRYEEAKGAAPIFRDIAINTLRLTRTRNLPKKRTEKDPIAMQLFRSFNQNSLHGLDAANTNLDKIPELLEGLSLMETLKIASKLNLLVKIKGQGLVHSVVPKKDAQGVAFFEIDLKRP